MITKTLEKILIGVFALVTTGMILGTAYLSAEQARRNDREYYARNCPGLFAKEPLEHLPLSYEK
jgi:hypothetical protein